MWVNCGMAAHHEGALWEWPVLGSGVPEALHLQTHLLRQFSPQGFFQSLAFKKKTGGTSI